MTEPSRTPALPEGREPGTIPGAGFEDLNASPIEGRVDLRGGTLRQQTARGALINSGFQIGLAALGLMQKLAVAVFLTTSEYGLWGLLVATVISLAFLKQIGIGDKYVQQDERDQVAAFQKAFTFELSYSLLFYVIMAAALPVYAVIYGRPEIIVPGLILSLALIGSALETPIWIAYRKMQFVRQRTLESVDPVTSTIVMVVLAASGAGYWSLIIGSVAGTIAGASAAIATSPYPLAWRFDRRALRDYFSFSWPLLLSGASGLIIVQGAVVIGNYAVGLAGLGAVALAGNLSMFADKVDSIIRRTIYPAVCAVKDRTEVLFETFVKSNRLALAWALPFGVGLALFAPDFVTYVLGDRWRTAQGLLQAFGLIIAARQIAFNYIVFFSAIGNTRPIAVIGALQVAVFAVVTAPLMIVLGLTGYAVGMAVSVVCELFLRAFYLRRLFADFHLFRHIARAVTPIIPPVAGVLLLRLADWGQRPFSQVLLELTFYGCATAASAWLFERRLMSEMAAYVAKPQAVSPSPSA
jgi:O-antigen/teichoic acid export membrane protein